MKNDLAFWETPDYFGDQPFWMNPPKIPYEKPVQSHRDWFTNRLHPCPENLPEAMRLINDDHHKSFLHYNEIDTNLIRLYDEAVKMCFGKRLVKIKDTKVFVWEGQYRKSNEVQLQYDAGIYYSGFTDMLADSGDFLTISRMISNHILQGLRIRYPDVRVSLPHHGHGSTKHYHNAPAKFWVGFVANVYCAGR